MLKSRTFLLLAISIGFCFSLSGFVWAEIGVKDFIANMEKNDKQTVLVGNIDSLTITRGNGQFQLGKGKLTLFDFGTGRILAMVFEGNGRFVYVPPDEVERGQLQRYIKRDTLISELSTVAFFTVNANVDSAGFTRGPVDKNAWKYLQNAERGLLQNLATYIPGIIYTNMSISKGTEFLCADIFDVTKNELIYTANPFNEDHYSLYRVRPEGKAHIIEKISGYGIDSLVRAPIDIQKYQLDIKAGGGGKVEGLCKINYVGVEDSSKCIPFRWSPKNSVKSVKDANGKPLSFISKEGWDGFVVVLNNPANLGIADSLSIEYSGKPMHSEWAINYCDTGYSWYPVNIKTDIANYSLSIEVPSKNTAIANGNFLRREGNSYSDSIHYNNFENETYLSLCYGSIVTSGLKSKSKVNSFYFVPLIKGWRNQIYFEGNSELIIAILNAAGEIFVFNDWFKFAEDEIYPHLTYLNKLIGFCPSDTLILLEAPFRHGKGTQGIAYLSTYFSSIRLRDIHLRAHEAAHLWWGNCIRPKSYRDEWITEGLAEYCAYLSFKNANPDTAKEDVILSRWRNKILTNSELGPVILGDRLRTTTPDTTGDYLISKSAYIFHMIRFLLKDYSSNSNDGFITFIRDLASQYRDKEISTAEFQTLLEQHTHRSMRWFFNQWVYGTGIPSYTFSYAVDSTAEKNYQVVCKIHQSGVPDRFMMQIPVTVVYESGAMVHFPCFVSDTDQAISLPLIPAKPREVLFNTFDAVLSRRE